MNTGLDLKIFETERFYNKNLFVYFAKGKNSKISLFYFFLREILVNGKFDDGKICINKQEKHYEFDICLKTIKNWLLQLQNEGFLKFRYTKKDIVYIQMLDYTKVKGMQVPVDLAKQIYPTRFYKDVQLIIKQALNKFRNKTIEIEGQKFIVEDFESKKELAMNQGIYLRAKLADDEQMNALIPYEVLTKQVLPSLKCNYHQAIIKKRIFESLNDCIVCPPFENTKAS